MVLNVSNLEGNERADYARSAVTKGRWSDTWDVCKSSFTKLLLINIFTLITFVPAVVVIIFRGNYIGNMGMLYPFNSSVLYPFYPDVTGLTERLTLSADLFFYATLIAAGVIAAIGLSGAAYSVRKLLNTHGEFTVKTYFRGIKYCFGYTVLPVTVFMLFLFATLIIGDWMHLTIATGGNSAGAITAYVFIIIATVLVGVYCAWVFAVGTTYRTKFTQVLKNAFTFVIARPLQTVIMAGFTLIPVWLFLIGGFIQFIAYVVAILIGFSFMVVCWTAFTQWVFDSCVNPNFKTVQEQPTAKKTENIVDDGQSEGQRARALLAAGKSDLLAVPVMPISNGAPVHKLSGAFTRADLTAVNDDRERLIKEVAAYGEQHKNDPAYAEYNKLFAEREKALQPQTGKKGKGKKISSDNLLK